MAWWIFAFAMVMSCAADPAPSGEVCGGRECVEVDTSAGPADVVVGTPSGHNKTTPLRLELAWSSFVQHQGLNADWCPEAWGWGVECIKNRVEREAYFRDYNSSGQWRTIRGIELDLGWYGLGYSDQLGAPWVYMLCITGLWCQDVSNARSGVYHGWDGVGYGQGWMQLELYLVAPAGTTSGTPKLAPKATIWNLYVNQ